MKVLITRPKHDAEGLEARLQSAGIDTVRAPMMEIVQQEISAEMRQRMLTAKDEGAGYLLFTSANGVRSCVAQCLSLVALPCFCVGAQTAQAASVAGFGQVMQAQGDVESLVALVLSSLAPEDGTLFHLRGHDHRGNLLEKLLEKQYSAHAVCAYNAKQTEELPLTVVRQICNDQVDAVLLYSPRTAKLFEAALRRANIVDACARMSVYALSRAVKDALEAPWRWVWYPESPSGPELEARIIADG